MIKVTVTSEKDQKKGGFNIEINGEMNGELEQVQNEVCALCEKIIHDSFSDEKERLSFMIYLMSQVIKDPLTSR